MRQRQITPTYEQTIDKLYAELKELWISRGNVFFKIMDDDGRQVKATNVSEIRELLEEFKGSIGKKHRCLERVDGYWEDDSIDWFLHYPTLGFKVIVKFRRLPSWTTTTFSIERV